MKILPADSNGIRAAVEVLRKDGVVFHATETCYGFACDLQSPSAVGRLFALKHRPMQLPVSALFHAWDDAKIYVSSSKEADAIAAKHLPGPLSLVLPRREGAPLLWVTPVHGGLDPTVGIRVSSHPVAEALVLAFRWPIATTSANVHGQPNPYSLAEMEAQFADSPIKPDLILDSGVLPVAPPSTVVEIKDGMVNVLRQGDVRVDDRI